VDRLPDAMKWQSELAMELATESGKIALSMFWTCLHDGEVDEQPMMPLEVTEPRPCMLTP